MKAMKPFAGDWQMLRAGTQRVGQRVPWPSAPQTTQPAMLTQTQQPMGQMWQQLSPQATAAQPQVTQQASQQPVGQNYLSQLLNFAKQPLGRQNYFQTLY